MSDDIDEMLEQLQSIKESRDDPTPDRPTDGECWNCGSSHVRKKVLEGEGALRSKNRLVGSKNVRLGRVCVDCGREQ